MTAAADRHLLFGLLALRNGLIEQGQLILAFQAWTRDKARSLADHLEARGGRRPRQPLHPRRTGDREGSDWRLLAGRDVRHRVIWDVLIPFSDPVPNGAKRRTAVPEAIRCRMRTPTRLRF
jgi:hypothetical protein